MPPCKRGAKFTDFGPNSTVNWRKGVFLIDIKILLSPREAVVLDLIVNGYTSKAAGTALRISARTVEFHRANIMAKLAARNVADLARIVASQSGLAEETTHEIPPTSHQVSSADGRTSAPIVTTADRYHFHLTDGDQTLLDRVGVELASVSEARQRATANGQLVVQNLNAVVKVTNGADKLVLFAPLSLAATTFNFEKSFTGETGRERWLATSKVPLHNSDGQVIGLAGVTGDVMSTSSSFWIRCITAIPFPMPLLKCRMV